MLSALDFNFIKHVSEHNLSYATVEEFNARKEIYAAKEALFEEIERDIETLPEPQHTQANDLFGKFILSWGNPDTGIVRFVGTKNGATTALRRQGKRHEPPSTTGRTTLTVADEVGPALRRDR